MTDVDTSREKFMLLAANKSRASEDRVASEALPLSIGFLFATLYPGCDMTLNPSQSCDGLNPHATY
jgi:hypothetical protein